MSPIKGKVFQHEQEYFFKFHTPKLDNLSKNEPRLRDYLHEVYDNCPDEFFSKSLRCSQTKLKNVELRKRAKSNGAIRHAKSALQNVTNNRMRHPAVQDFMLANDEATIACEVPVYLAPWEVPGMERPLSGHIDILQMRGDKIWILDYKPNARYNIQKYMTQVFLYSVCLSRRTKISMDNIGMAYFDDTHYFEVNVLEQGALI
jgi:ATP-dependent exoDNAse (exonuclease V) beta subunit